MGEEVVDVVGGVVSEEGLLVDETQGEGLEGLEEELDVLLAELWVHVWLLLRVDAEDVPCVVGRVDFHPGYIRP